MPIFRSAVLPVAVASLLGLFASGASAQSPADFYKGRQLTMLNYSTPGGAYDTYGRFLIRYFGNHIPGNPTFVAQNMPGAGGLKAAEYLARYAPKDGSVIGMLSRGFPFDPMLGENPMKLEPLKYNWIGSMNREIALAMSWYTQSVKTLDDLRKTELLVAGTGAAADSEIIPTALNNLAGTKFKIISGYRGLSAGALAMERGEVQGLAYWSLSAVKQKPDWIRDRKLNLIFHTGVGAHPELPGVPSIRDAVSDEINRQAIDVLLAREIIGRPVVMPPDVPADRVKVIREAFIATMKDGSLLEEAKKRGLEVNLVTGAEVDAVLKKASESPKEVIDRVKAALGRS